jgi:hypothetical protein
VTIKYKTALLCRKFTITLLFFGIAACSTMQPTQHGFSGFEAKSNDINPHVSWQLEHQNISDDQKVELELHVSKLLKSVIQNHAEKNMYVRANITRVETASPILNAMTTLLAFIPLDRGGAAIEIQAIDQNTGEQIFHGSYAKWMPKSEFISHFSSMALAKLALEDGIQNFNRDIDYALR